MIRVVEGQAFWIVWDGAVASPSRGLLVGESEGWTSRMHPNWKYADGDVFARCPRRAIYGERRGTGTHRRFVPRRPRMVNTAFNAAFRRRRQS